MRKVDNRGISLVEIMVTVAIMGVVAAVGLWSLNTVSGRPAQQCAQKVIYSLERHRTTAMGKSEAYYKLIADTSGKILFEEGIKVRADDDAYSVTTTEIGGKRVTVSYVDPTSGAVLPLNPGSSLEFRFDRGSGAFDKNFYPCRQLIIKSGGREVHVTLVQLTGKVYLD